MKTKNKKTNPHNEMDDDDIREKIASIKLTNTRKREKKIRDAQREYKNYTTYIDIYTYYVQ